ncbi:MAG: hypothetical protein R3F55_19430 [Alphaproteobacteria bacterium]
MKILALAGLALSLTIGSAGIALADDAVAPSVALDGAHTEAAARQRTAEDSATRSLLAAPAGGAAAVTCDTAWTDCQGQHETAAKSADAATDNEAVSGSSAQQ